MSKFGRKLKEPPSGWDYVEPTLTALENELREKVNEPHEGLRKNESQWPVFQINWQKSRYIYDLFYTYHKISREVYDYCINNKLVDAALIAKWKKTGYERLCSTYVINPSNYKFGTVSICRVPSQLLPPGTVIEDPTTGCHGCASGSRDNIFGNKYGQYLAAIQVAREERRAQLQAQQEARAAQGAAADSDSDSDSNDDDDDGGDDDANDNGESSNNGYAGKFGGGKGGEDDEEDDADAPVETADGRSKPKSVIWARNEAELNMELSRGMVGQQDAEAQQEAIAAMQKHGTSSSRAAATNIPGKRVQASGPPGKRSRPI